ncbi:hypothetical protein C8J57DRAFT_1324320 [Mycena rebaudengoi]|nr:hypothetical protein C8J57DRAFT_1324320 [Mycena rebaudengoi]
MDKKSRCIVFPLFESAFLFHCLSFMSHIFTFLAPILAFGAYPYPHFDSSLRPPPLYPLASLLLTIPHPPTHASSSSPPTQPVYSLPSIASA